MSVADRRRAKAASASQKRRDDAAARDARKKDYWASKGVDYQPTSTNSRGERNEEAISQIRS